MDRPARGKAREGKYCPRCQTMTLREQEVCGHCGHRFRTGLEETDLYAPITDEAALHRTMQFTLPPLPVRGTPAPGRVSPDALTSGPAQAYRWPGKAFAASVALLLALLAGLGYLRPLAMRRAAPSPVGVWETTLSSHSAGAARLGFDFRADGSGLFSWSATSIPPISGQAALHWRVDPDGKLALTIAPPASPDAVSGALTTTFNSRPWRWQVDRGRQRLRIGTLTFQKSSP